MIRAVFDTNVLISAALSRTGPPFKCLDLAKQGVVESVTCKEILDEFKQKMIEKFKRSTDQADDLVGDVLGYSQVASITGELRAVEADPSDDKVVECAVVGGATHIVSGDSRHLLKLGRYRDIPIIKPAEFLALVEQDLPQD